MGVTICTCNQPVSVPSSTVSIEEEKPTDKLKKISTEKTHFQILLPLKAKQSALILLRNSTRPRKSFIFERKKEQKVANL